MPYLRDRLGNERGRHRSFVGQRLQRRDGDMNAVDFEEAAQLSPVVGAAETVGAQHAIAAGTNGRIWSASSFM